MIGKPFNELTSDEAKAVVKEIVRTSNSEEQIKCRLTEAGFNGDKAAITSTRSGPIFMAIVMIYGPKSEIISA